MDLADYARSLRRHDWSADFSDSYEVTRRANRRMANLKSLANLSRNHLRLFKLGCSHEQRFTWSAEEGATGYAPRAEVYEAAWRWVGAYCWVQGVMLTEDEAKEFVGAVDGHRDWYGKQVSTARCIDWAAVDARVEKGA